MKRYANLLKIILPLSLLPASASAVSFSNLQLTNTSFSVDIEGTISGAVPGINNDSLFIVNPDPNVYHPDPGFTTPGQYDSYATTISFDGSPSLGSGGQSGYISAPSYSWDFILVVFPSDLVVGSPLEGTLAGSWSTEVFDPSAVSSLDFYWGTNEPGVSNGTFLGSASLSAVPDTGSTAALLGVGVVALAFAKRRLG